MSEYPVQDPRALLALVLEGEGGGGDASRSRDALLARAELMRWLTAGRWEAIDRARRVGLTWAEIGDALGVSRQAAHQLHQEHAHGLRSDDAERTTRRAQRAAVRRSARDE